MPSPQDAARLSADLREQAYVCRIAGLLENAKLSQKAADALEAAHAEQHALRIQLTAANKVADEARAELARLRAPAGDAMEEARLVADALHYLSIEHNAHYKGKIWINPSRWFVVDTRSAEPEANWPGELVKECASLDEAKIVLAETAIRPALTVAKARAAQAERERAEPVIEAAQALYEAHCQTNAKYDAPAKFSMNYAELNNLRDTIATYKDGKSR